MSGLFALLLVLGLAPVGLFVLRIVFRLLGLFMLGLFGLVALGILACVLGH